MNNKQHQPLISVIMNCYNGEKYLKYAVNSVLEQTYSNWELVFWDDQSIDNSSEIFKMFEDERLKYYLSNKRANLSESRILAIKKSKGEILTFLDVDDYWDDTFLEKQVSLYKDKSISFSCGNFFVITEGSSHKKIFRKIIPSGRVVNELLMDYSVGLLTLAMRKSAYLDVGGFSSDYHIIGDFDLVMKLAKQGNMGSFQKPLAYCRKHNDNESSLKPELHLQELEKWHEKNSIFFNEKAVNVFYNSLMYKKYVNAINSNSFSFALFIEALKDQPITNFIKIILIKIRKKAKREF